MDSLRDKLTADDLSVVISDLLVATAETSDALIDNSVPEVLGQLRQKMNMDVVFVSEFIDGRRVFRFVDASQKESPIAAGGSDPLEESFCKLIVDGRLPELIHDVSKAPPVEGQPETAIRIGAHLSTPIVMKDGSVYGTLCCFSAHPNEALQLRDLTALRHCAQLVARKLDQDAKDGRGFSDWSLAPMDKDKRRG